MPTGRELVLGTLFKGRLSPEFNTAVTKLKKDLQLLNALLGTTSRKAGTASVGLNKLGRSMDKSTQGTNKVTKSTELMNKQIAKASSGYERFMGALKVTASYSVAAAAIFAITRTLRLGVVEIANYDQALKNLQAITGATDTQIAAMGDSILQVARQSKFFTTEIADGMVLLGQSGFTAEESMQAIKSAADLAAGTLSEMNSVTDLLTTTIRAFGLDATESGRVVDVMGNAINRSKLTVDKLRIAFNFVGASAAQAGLSIEETAATMMTLANNGLRASTIGTGFRQVLAKMIAPSEKLRETMESYGIELNSINPTIVGFRKALENLAVVLIDGETGLVDMGKAFDLFKLRGAQAAAIMVKSFMSGDWNAAMENAMRVGTAAEMANIQLKGLTASFKNLLGRAGALAVSIGEGGVAGSLRVLITVGKVIISAIDWFIRTGSGQTVVAFGLITSAIGVLVLALKGLAIAAAAVNLTAFLSLPIVTVVGSLAALAAILIQLTGSSGKYKEELGKLSAQAKSVGASIFAFRKRLEDLHESQESDAPVKYEKTLERMIKNHPEVADKVDIATASFEELRKALIEVEEEQSKIDFDSMKKRIDLVTESLDKPQWKPKFWRTFMGVITVGLSTVDPLMQNWFENMEKGTNEIKELTSIMGSYFVSLKQKVDEGKLTTEQARAEAMKWIESHKAIKDVVEKELLPEFER